MRTLIIIIALSLAVISGARPSAAQDAAGRNCRQPCAHKGFRGNAMITSAFLKWDPYEGPEGYKLAGYKIYRHGEGEKYGPPLKIVGPINMWTDSGLEKGTKYFYTVAAFSAEGQESELSDELQLQTAEHPPFHAYVGDMRILRIPTLDVLCVIDQAQGAEAPDASSRRSNSSAASSGATRSAGSISGSPAAILKALLRTWLKANPATQC